MSTTDTPETDKAAKKLNMERDGYDLIQARFSRRIERERDEARADNQRLREALTETAECLACWAGDSRSNEATRVVLNRAKVTLASGKGGEA